MCLSLILMKKIFFKKINFEIKEIKLGITETGKVKARYSI